MGTDFTKKSALLFPNTNKCLKHPIEQVYRILLFMRQLQIRGLSSL